LGKYNDQGIDCHYGSYDSIAKASLLQNNHDKGIIGSKSSPEYKFKKGKMQLPLIHIVYSYRQLFHKKPRFMKHMPVK